MGSRSRLKQRTIKKDNAVPASRTLKSVAYICVAIGFSSFLGFQELTHLENTRHGTAFFFLFGFIGVLLSLPFYRLIYKTVPDLKARLKIKTHWESKLFMLGLGFFLLIPAIACYVNRTNVKYTASCNECEVIRKEKTEGKYFHYYLYVQINNNEERLSVSKPFWEAIQKGQNIRLCVQQGILGFEYIKIDKYP